MSDELSVRRARIPDLRRVSEFAGELVRMLHDVYVTSDGRRHGAGRLLVEAMVKELDALGASSIVLHTMVSNVAAQKLFESCGFRATMIEMTRSRG